MQLVGVDVGGTNVMVGLVDDDHEVTATAKEPTPDTAAGVIDLVVGMVQGLDARPHAVGVGLPGIIHDGVVKELPNLEGWTEDSDVVGQLADRLGVPVAVGNDAQVGVLGEWVAGAARDARFVLGVWLGTGVGGGLVLDGRPYDGAHGTAGELGHVNVQPGGAICGCGRRGCLEAYAGRRMMTHAARRLVEAGRTTSLFEIMERKGKTRPTSAVWDEALDDGDELVVELFDRAIEALGVGVGSAINLLDPDLVVVGGGLAEKLGQDLADRIADAAAPIVLHDAKDRRVVAAELGDDSGVVGAAWLARGALAAS